MKGTLHFLYFRCFVSCGKTYDIKTQLLNKFKLRHFLAQLSLNFVAIKLYYYKTKVMKKIYFYLCLIALASELIGCRSKINSNNENKLKNAIANNKPQPKRFITSNYFVSFSKTSHSDDINTRNYSYEILDRFTPECTVYMNLTDSLNKPFIYNDKFEDANNIALCLKLSLFSTIMKRVLHQITKKTYRYSTKKVSRKRMENILRRNILNKKLNKLVNKLADNIILNRNLLVDITQDDESMSTLGFDNKLIKAITEDYKKIFNKYQYNNIEHFDYQITDDNSKWFREEFYDSYGTTICAVSYGQNKKRDVIVIFVTDM